MLWLYATDDAVHLRRQLVDAIRGDWPDLEIREIAAADVGQVALFRDGAPTAWDDLFIVAFGTDGIDQRLHAAFEREIANARQSGRACRVLPVSTGPERRRPPAPLGAIKAIQYRDDEGDHGDRLSRRVGALLGLWLRGDNHRVFVSHRKSDGESAAREVTRFLTENGYDAWFDDQRLDGGDIVPDEIERNVQDSSLLLLLDTPEAAHSEWMWREVDAALRGFVPILPVVMRPSGGSVPPMPGFRNAAELFFCSLTVVQQGNGEVIPPDDSALQGMLAGMEQYLSRILRSQRALAAKVEQAFLDAGFQWQVLDGRRHLYNGEKYDQGDLTRFLSHCSAVSPRNRESVLAFRNLTLPSPARNDFNLRLFVYEPPLPQPELTRLRAEYGLDAVLRLVDPGRLSALLQKY